VITTTLAIPTIIMRSAVDFGPVNTCGRSVPHPRITPIPGNPPRRWAKIARAPADIVTNPGEPDARRTGMLAGRVRILAWSAGSRLVPAPVNSRGFHLHIV
jgi:hypothetical protein